MNKRIIALCILALGIATGANAQQICTTTDQTQTNQVCHVEQISITENVCHNEYARWDILHLFPRRVCEDVTTTHDENICEDVTTTTPVTTCEEVDTNKPVITINGANPFKLPQGSPFIDPGASAYDQEDGDISDQICSAGNVDTQKSGDYTITYNVSDAAGNAADQASRTVTVEAGGAARIMTPPKIINYSFQTLSPNVYSFNFVGKYIDGRFTYDKIKWGGTQNEMEQREWQRYKENGNIVHTESDTVHFWFKNGDGTGNYMTVKVK